ncbi:MAG: glycoside hydrolase family 19 protein [Chloroflexota bacterium]
MDSRSPLWLHLPDEDHLTDDDVALVRQLRPSGLLALRYPWPQDKGAAERVIALVRELEHESLIVRFFDRDIPGKPPGEWAGACADRMGLYDALRADGVRLEAILANEVDLEDPEGGHRDWERHADWFGELARAWRDVSDDVLHLPAPSRQRVGNQDPNDFNTAMAFWGAIKRAGVDRQYDRVDVHAYRQDLLRAGEECRSILGSVANLDVTETNGDGVIARAAAAVRAGTYARVVWFIADWRCYRPDGSIDRDGMRGEERAEQGGTPMSIAKWPHLRAEWLKTLESDEPQPEPSDVVAADRSATGEGTVPSTVKTFFTTSQIATAAGVAPAAVEATWPAVLDALAARGVDDRATQIAAIATTRVETGTRFAPIDEFGGSDYFFKMYDIQGDRPAKARELGNVNPGDGVRYHGRGVIQLTGRGNYRRYGQELGVALEDNPSLALDSSVSAGVLAAYFVSRGVPEAARRGDWEGVRRKVNGGLNGWDVFIDVVRKLDALMVREEPADLRLAAATREIATLKAGVATLEARVSTLEEDRSRLINALAYALDDVVSQALAARTDAARKAVASEATRLRVEQIGARPEG